ncbi:hypothetical protein PSR47_07495 [Ligilactobacillus ruminis]|nr:hypothetical protein [Ligilactobacillus ruminis]WDC79617.1 hypothetical protein PSR47_07495 [Ligilactobacillus ruminis]
MAQLNITLNQEEILQLLSKDHDQAFRELLRKSLNSILMAESTLRSRLSLTNDQKNARTAATALENASSRHG